jgi:hypothetical protein
VKHKVLFVALVIGFLGSSAPAGAQRHGSSSAASGDPMLIPHIAPNAGSKYADYLYGIVKVVNEDQMVLTKTKSGADETYKFNKKTKFICDGKSSSFDSVKLGEAVWVDADEDKKTGDFTARKVVTGVLLMN